MSTSAYALSGREPDARLSLANRREDEEAMIDNLLFEDQEWEADFDGWLIDQTLDESGIVIELDQENG
jgi:hypothetical protein